VGRGTGFAGGVGLERIVEICGKVKGPTFSQKLQKEGVVRDTGRFAPSPVVSNGLPSGSLKWSTS
jgi:hypothetical protein